MTTALVLRDDGIIDEVAVERVIAGRYVPLRPAERHEVARRMHTRGRSVTDIAKTLRVSNSTVQRLMVCVLHERAQTIASGGPCDRCRSAPAAWQVTCPDGAVRELCLTDAVRVLQRLDDEEADRD